MGDVVHFVPRSDQEAAANLAEFIRMAKENLTAFAHEGAWDSDKWVNEDGAIVFATKTQPLGPYNFTPMAQPFKDFAKAYFRYSYSHRPTKSTVLVVQALRCIESALLSARGHADISLLNGAVMDQCAVKCREFYASAEVQCNTGRKIEAIFDFLREKRLVPMLPPWKSPFKKPVILTEDLGEEGRKHREKKLPSNDTMLAVADLFAQADDAESQYFSSILIILMATPSRISEVINLPLDCIQWEPDNAGVQQMYLRWRAAKGKGAMKKWVIPAMHDVVKEAVRRLQEIGEPARAAARFAHENQGKFMRHPGCLADTEDLDAILTPEEFCAAMDIQGGVRNGKLTWSQINVEKGLKQLIQTGRPRYRLLADFVHRTYAGPYWPYINAARTVESWNALCLHRRYEFHKEFPAKQFSWRLPTANDVNSRLEHGRSLLDRFGLVNPDGSCIKLTTHQLRHWLSTISERAGMDDYTLAQWAGRAKVTDNRHYDHRTPEERLEVAASLLPNRPAPLLERIKHRQPVTYQELGVDRLGTAKATLYGMCVHDYAMAPCQKQRECMTCKEHVCIKGDHVTLDRILLLEKQLELLLKKAREAQQDGDFGADRWVDNHKWKLAHVRTMRIILEKEEVPDGSAIRIPEGHDPSPVRRALRDLGLDSQSGNTILELEQLL